MTFTGSPSCMPLTLALHFNEDGTKKAALIHEAKPAKKTKPKAKAAKAK